MQNIIQFYRMMLNKALKNTGRIHLTPKEQFALLCAAGVVIAIIFVSIFA